MYWLGFSDWQENGLVPLTDNVLQKIGIEICHSGHSKLAPEPYDAQTYGQKAIGLLSFPTDWTPPFFAIGTSLNANWNIANNSQKIEISELLLEYIKKWQESEPIANFEYNGHGIWLRSSAVSETIQKRGQLESELVEDLTSKNLRSYLESLFVGSSKSGSIGVVVQIAIDRDSLYHFSNERRFSPTRNQWEISVDNSADPHISPGGCNSKSGITLTENQPLSIRPNERSGNVRALIRGIGRWANSKYSGRIHFEIVRSNYRLFLVQVDHEVEIDGIDPRKAEMNFTAAKLTEPTIFKKYQIDKNVRFLKLTNIADFSVDDYIPPHRLFYLELEQLRVAIKNHQSQVVNEIVNLTGGRLVLREDIDKSKVNGDSYNLARTDTVNPAQAIEHIQRRIEYWRGKSENLNNICIIMHGFIPAQSSAWAMYDRSEKRVRIHALWGLPDGLQYLTPDEYEFDIAVSSWSERINFKEFFLQEQGDGSWIIQPILLSSARTKVLSKKQINEIADLTIKIGEKLETDVHIMFFCSVPRQLEMGDVLPWFRARETTVYEAKRERRLKKVIVRKLSDLAEIGSSDDIALSLEPEIEHYRDNEFVRKVAQFANENSLPIEIQGSPLAHAYYILKDSGCTVFLAHARKNERVRSKQKFGKLVRDKIVDKIEKSGEESVSFKLSPSERNAAFFGKIIEEAVEVVHSQSEEERIGEFADLYETILGWIRSSGFEFSEVTTLASEKRKKAGGFNSGEILVGTGIKTGGIRGPKSSKYGLEDVTYPRLSNGTLKLSAARLGLIASGKIEKLYIEDADVNLLISMDDEGHLQLNFTEVKSDNDQLDLGI